MFVCLKPVGKYVHKTTFMHFYRMLFVRYLERLKNDGVGAELKKSNSITIPKYTGVMNFEYAHVEK